MFSKAKLTKPIISIVSKNLFNTEKFNICRLNKINNFTTNSKAMYCKNLSHKYFSEELRNAEKVQVESDLSKIKKSKIKVPTTVLKSKTRKEEIKEEKIDSSLGKTLISSQLLCQLIGTKHYPINEEIKLDRYTVVKCYDENENFLGNKTLGEVEDDANEIGKDVVLRNDKTNPPIVKIMRYKIELIKRLLRKLSKNKEFKLNEVKAEKLITIPLETEDKDILFKTNKARELLKHFSHLKIAIFCNVNNQENEYKASNLLNFMAESLSDVAKIHTPVKTSYKSKSNISEFNEKKVIINDEDAQDIMDRAAIRNKDVKIGREDTFNHEDLDYNDSFVIELESMLIDTSGIDYEQILESNTIEDIFSGLKNEKFKRSEYDENIKEEEEEVETKSDIILDFEDQIKELERTLEAEVDFTKRIFAKRKILALKGDINYNKNRILAKTIIKKIFIDIREQSIARRLAEQ